MAMLTNKNLIALLLLMIVGGSSCLQRTLDYAFNEDCKDLCKNTNIRLGHVKATGPNDTIHYIWDFTKNPTIFIAVTSPTSKLNVDWRKYISRLPLAVNFTEKPIYTFGVVIERLLEFDDIYDSARIDDPDFFKLNNSNIVEVDLKNFQWTHKNLTKHDNIVEFYTEASNYTDPNTNKVRNGKIKFLLQGFSTLNHSHVTPRMLHSENATQVDIIIDHLDTKVNFTKSRFAFELLIVSENDPESMLIVEEKRKLDDEYTPGIFEVMELMTPGTLNKTGYLQWRPVSYKDSGRDTINSTSTFSYPVKSASIDEYFNKNNFLYLYYGENRMLDNLAQRVNVSIGEQQDGFYKASNYSTWTFIAGYGTPPDEQFSFIVTIIIVIGIGVPILVLISAGVYKFIRLRRRDNELMIR